MESTTAWCPPRNSKSQSRNSRGMQRKCGCFRTGGPRMHRGSSHEQQRTEHAPGHKESLICGLAACAIAAALLSGCSKDDRGQIVRDAYIYGYPLVTMDMTRRQETNVSVPDDAHAPVGQIIKLRSYPAVDNHGAAAPNADTLYTMAWLDVSAEPWVFSIPDMGRSEE